MAVSDMKLEFFPNLSGLALLLSIGVTTLHADAPKSGVWITSTEAGPWVEQALVAAPAGTTGGTNVLMVDTNTTLQTMDGFGGCFNDLGWQALKTLDETGRAEALQALFGANGCRFNLARAPIGANDFSLGWYSLDETPGDLAMKDFSIERDRRELIPYMQAAMKYQPDLGVWGVPWCPPAWMKTNGQYRGGGMRQEPAVLAAYALYFSKYVQAYRAAGIHLYAVMPQNEPNYNDNVYPQCAWTGAELNRFIRDYLVPQLRRDQVQVRVWHGTLATSADAWVAPALQDPVTRSMLTGVSFQYDGQKALLKTHERCPELKLIQSETECYNGLNTWGEGLTTFRKIIEDTRNYAGGYFFWNMVLNETGRSTWNWRQNSLITVDRTAHKVIYNPEFYALKQVSAAVSPGAKRVAVSGGPFKYTVAFLNPAGSEVLVFENDAARPVTAEIEAAGARWRVEAPARSMNTVTFAGQ